MALVGELVGLLGRLPGPSRAVRLEAMPANHALTSRRPHAFPPFLRQFWEEFCTPGPQKQESNTTYSGVSLHQPWRRASEYSTHQHPSRLNFQKGLFTPVRTSVELHSKDMKRRKQTFEVQHLDGRVSRRDWARAVGELLSLKTILLAFTDHQPMLSPAQTGEPQPGPQRQGAQCFENIPIVGCPVMGTWQ